MIQSLREKASVLLSVEGGKIGTLCMPVFQIAAGELVCLHFPSYCQEEQRTVTDFLTCKTKSAMVQASARVIWAEPPGLERSFFNRLRNQRADKWLAKNGKMSLDRAEALVKSLGIRPSKKVTSLARNLGTLLGLEAAFSQGPCVALFSTIGCDPLGIRQIHAYILSRLDQSAAIRFSYPFIQNGILKRECFAGSICIEVSRQDEPMSIKPNAYLTD